MHRDEQRAADGDQGIAHHQHGLSASTINIGGTAHDTSNLTGDVADTGAGTVAYSYYTNNTCTTGQVAVNTVTVPTSGNVPNSNAVDLQQCRHLLLAGGLQR